VSVPSIVDFVTHPHYLGLALSTPQTALLKAIYGLDLTDEEGDLFRQCTGRESYKPGHAFGEVTVIAGRRAGKDSRIACPIALYEAVFGGYEQQLHKGERGLIPLIAQDERSTRVAFTYIRDYLITSPALRTLLAEEFRYELRLVNHLAIIAFACTAKSLRGYSIPAAVMDEVAFFRSESGATVDYEVQRSIRPAGVSFEQQRLIKISTPHVKGGVIWDDYASYFGQDNPDCLVWQASTALMNPSIKGERLAKAARVDQHHYAREYEALFSDASEGAIPSAWIDAAIVEGRAALAPVDGAHYLAAVDPSGGSFDEFALSVVHIDNGKFIQDLHRAWAASRFQKVDLSAICQEIADLIRPYGLARVVGDHYAGKWVEQEFRRVNVSYIPWTGTKSDAYKEMIPFFAQLRIEILDETVLIRQLRLLERRLRLGGKPPIIDHPKGGHDDRANALAVAVATLAKSMAPALDIGHYARPGWERGEATTTEIDAASQRMWDELFGRPAAGNFWGRRGETDDRDRPGRHIWGLW